MVEQLSAPSRPDGRRRELVGRLHRVEGQIRGIAGMVESDRYCIDILTQIAAASRALESVALVLLDDHIRHCLIDPERPSREALVKEASEAIARLVRS